MLLSEAETTMWQAMARIYSESQGYAMRVRMRVRVRMRWRVRDTLFARRPDFDGPRSPSQDKPQDKTRTVPNK